MFGNTTTVIEPDPANPSTSTYTTTYTFNAVNSLLKVNLGTRNGLIQGNRTFAYDSTTRLTSKYEPETGTTSFTYNADGTVHTKTFGNNNVVTYAYDTYGRETSDGIGTIGYDSYGQLANLYSTQAHSYLPLGGTNLYGHIAYKQEPCASFGSTAYCTEFFSYSPLGKVTQEVYAIAYGSASYYSPAITASFSYDDEGRLASIGYPDGTGYTYAFDAMGRPNAISGPNGPTASGALYNPAGQITQVTQSGQIEDRNYNNLNQLTGIRRGSQIYTNYNYNAGTNNGQMASMQDRANGNATAYTYDSLKRLSSTQTTKFPTVTNAGFESITIPSWAGSGIVSSAAHSGLASLQLNTGSQVQQPFGCSGSCGTPATYTVTGYVQSSGSTSGVFVNITGNQSFSASGGGSSSSGWTKFSFQFTTPSGFTGGLNVSLAPTTNANSAVYVDDLSITVSSGSNLLANGGFESGATPTNWSGGATSTGTVHSGTLSASITGTSAISQTVTGLSPSTSYNVGVWYYLLAGCTLTLNAGGTGVQSTTAGSWQFLYGSWTSTSSGTLPISISVSPTGGLAYLDDVTISGGPASPAVTQSETFGFDGFGNLLSQTPTAGSGPMMSLTVDNNTNRVSGQGSYDGAGNFLGNSQYSYDILNRLSKTGSYSYAYSPGDNKRMAVYSSSGSNATASFNIYDLNGRKMGVYVYTATAPWSEPAQVSFAKDIPYLGGKRIDVSEDQVGSNWDQTQYYPWGQVQAGQQPTETQGFGTYVLDGGSGLYYADQRFYNQNWGRLLTPDPSNANVDVGNSGSWNRYAYTNGDPVNGFDAKGEDDCLDRDDCDEDTCDPSDASVESCPGYGQGSGTGSGNTTSPPITLGEATQLESLEQDGLISGFYNTATAIGVTLSGGQWEWAASVCIAQPELCVIGGTLFTIYVAYKYLPGFVSALEKAAGDIGPTSWPACIPPVGTIGYRYDKSPPGRPHWPHKGDHLHLFRMTQDPSSGICRWNRIGTSEPPPQPGWVPIAPEMGGTPR